jgi:hypothetical protein
MLRVGRAGSPEQSFLALSMQTGHDTGRATLPGGTEHFYSVQFFAAFSAADGVRPRGADRTA